jgi:radical SAM protein with 4Fe4S-binding SPASM domain
MGFDSFPLVVGWELTLACNLRCGHCASSAGLPRPNEFDLDEALYLCDQFPALLVQEVDFTGGEPLLRPGWIKIAERLNELRISTRVVTNGLLLKENVSSLKDSGIATVGVSLDGLEVTHDSIRKRPGLFQQVIAGIEAALAADLPTAVITAVNERNVSELPKLFAFLQSIGIRHWQVQPTFVLGRAKEGGEFGLSDSSFLELGKFICNHVALCETVRFRMVPADGVGYFTNFDTRNPAWRGCAAGIVSCGITSNGKVKGCLSFPDHLIEGDLRERDLWDIWFDEESFAYNRRFLLKDLGEYCTGCKFGEYCKGGCTVMSYAATHQFHNDPYCFHGILARQNLRPFDFFAK